MTTDKKNETESEAGLWAKLEEFTRNGLDLKKLTLDHGSHRTRTQGVCMMEAVAWWAGEKHSDHPQCVDRALTEPLIRLNDRYREDERQKLIPLIPLLPGTRGTYKLSMKRALFIVDRTVRWLLPLCLRELPNKPRADLAEQFEGLPPIVDRESAERARDLARKLRDEVRVSLSAAAAAYAYAYAYAAADAADAADAAAYRALRERTVERTIQIMREAIALTEDAQ